MLAPGVAVGSGIGVAVALGPGSVGMVPPLLAATLRFPLPQARGSRARRRSGRRTILKGAIST